MLWIIEPTISHREWMDGWMGWSEPQIEHVITTGQTIYVFPLAVPFLSLDTNLTNHSLLRTQHNTHKHWTKNNWMFVLGSDCIQRVGRELRLSNGQCHHKYHEPFSACWNDHKSMSLTRCDHWRRRRRPPNSHKNEDYPRARARESCPGNPSIIGVTSITVLVGGHQGCGQGSVILSVSTHWAHSPSIEHYHHRPHELDELTKKNTPNWSNSVRVFRPLAIWLCPRPLLPHNVACRQVHKFGQAKLDEFIARAKRVQPANQPTETVSTQPVEPWTRMLSGYWSRVHCQANQYTWLDCELHWLDRVPAQCSRHELAPQLDFLTTKTIINPGSFSKNAIPLHCQIITQSRCWLDTKSPSSSP